MIKKCVNLDFFMLNWLFQNGYTPLNFTGFPKYKQLVRQEKHNNKNKLDFPFTVLLL